MRVKNPGIRRVISGLLYSNGVGHRNDSEEDLITSHVPEAHSA